MTPIHIFSVVVLVLLGAAFLFYSKRNASDDDFSEPDAEETLTAATVTPAPAPAPGVNAKHVAAVMAAILTATRGRGKILSITPASRADFAEATRRWRAVGIVASVGRRLAPSWKR